jgi:ribosome-binding factor A
MVHHQSSAIKRAQKESLLLHVFSELLLQITLDDSRIQGIYVNRVKLSSDKSVCTIFFYTPDGPDTFNEKLGYLLLYKPSLRKAIAQAIPSRYVPELVFKFDDQFEKQQRVDELLDRIKEN